MKINTIKRILLEDFPQEQRRWLVKLIDPLNQWLEQSYSSLVKGLTVSDNLKAQKYSVNIEENQTYPIKLSYSLNERPCSVHIGWLSEDSGSPAAPSNAYSVYWNYTNTGIEVTFIGLDSSKKYKTTLIAQV